MVELHGITKKYKTCTAVDNLTLHVHDGEVFGLVGPNGAGKSTTVSMLSTINTPTSGDIRIAGMTLSANNLKIKQLMGVVPQELALYQTLNAYDNLSFFGSLYGLSGHKLEERIDEVLDIVELTDKAGQAVSEYSGGMKRRINIGVALMNHPKLLILDEPTVGIDPQSRNHILETIKRLNREWNMTIIYTSHYMEEVEFLCERVGIIDFGKLKALGTVEELKQTFHISDTLIISCGRRIKSSPEIMRQVKSISGIQQVDFDENELRCVLSAGNADVLFVMEQLKKLDVPIVNFQFRQANLEDVFLQITGKSLRE
ncbi:MAG: ABC transporter ATP-binding protein [Bacillota bacterium]|nr:ABC transporter ATP-binding protein [Bacillota bacterium]